MPSYHLLIVDDDAVDQSIYSKFLRRLGADSCQIQQAANGVSGLAALRNGKFDCVLLDLKLPDMTGLEFLAAAVVDNELPCAVVLITGQGSEAIAVEAMKHGAQDYLVKCQLNADNLWATLARAVTQVELRRRLAFSVRNLTTANLSLEQEIESRIAAEAELRTAKELADQASQVKTRFVAMVTHELRTPLNSILGYGQLLRIEGGLSKRQDDHVAAMMQASRHLVDMIERVLDFAAIEAGRLELHPAWMAVRDLTDDCIDLISPLANERGLGLRVVIAHDAPRQTFADPTRLRQVLLNLLGNAVKYTEAGSLELRVLAGATPGGLRIEVADTGCGISAESRERLFQDFERLETASSVEGTGLGLAIVARIIRMMGGTIHYDENPVGGSVFWFDIPGGGPASPRLPVAAPANMSSKHNVLLVDDIKINRDIIGAFLDSAGHRTIMVDNGHEAVRQAATQPFDVILMDVRMAEMDGLEATRCIRKLPGRDGQVPILALTAYTFPDQVAQCLEAGMDGHVPKPVDYNTLMTAIDEVIARVSPNLALATA